MVLKEKNNVQLPKGCKGERGKAFDKWFAELKAKKPTDASAKPKAKPKAKSVRALTMQPDSSDSGLTDPA